MLSNGDVKFMQAQNKAMLQGLSNMFEVDAVMVSPADQERIDHNNARYHQLQLLRRGQPNTYMETEYR